jgi:hypothetical protein
VLEEDHDVGSPGEPVERTEEARGDRTERGTIRDDRPVDLADPLLVERDLGRPQPPEEQRPTIPTAIRQLVASATMPASGTPITPASVLSPITVPIALPRSRYVKLSPTVAVTFGKMSDPPMPEITRIAMRTAKLVAKAASSVKTPMTRDPATRNRLRPKRSEYGPVRRATTMPGIPYAATARPAVPVVIANSPATCVSTGAMTIPT